MVFPAEEPAHSPDCLNCLTKSSVGLIDEAGRGLLQQPDCPCVEDPENACVRCKTEKFTQHLHPEPEPDEPEDDEDDESEQGEDDDEDAEGKGWSPPGSQPRSWEL